jgi:succinate dehydrogenase / fumarate reductase, cytochrome b subunit
MGIAMTVSNRPLSPHIQIYRWPINMTTSILHRASGVALAAGMLLLVCWIAALARGPGSFDLVQHAIASFLGRLLLFGWTWALFFHLSNGIRHLIWDAGAGYDVKTATRTAWLVLAASVVLTLVAWSAGYAAMGAFG